MLLVIDIGNSRIKTAIFDQDKIISSDSFIDQIKFESYLKSQDITEIAICSVVPDKAKLITQQISGLKGISPFVITNDMKTNLSVTYKTPETLGIDRLCSAEGAFFLFKKSKTHKSYNRKTYILTIDFGTATTINIIEYPGKFIGGLIAPGIDMMFESLNKKTAQLPDVIVSDFNSVIGDGTKSSIASGVINSNVGLIEKNLDYLKEEKSAKEIIVYLTGGNANKIIPHLNFEFIYEENLVFYGINTLYIQNKKTNNTKF